MTTPAPPRAITFPNSSGSTAVPTRSTLRIVAGRVLHDWSRTEILRPGPLRELFGVDVEVQEIGGVYHLW